MRRSTLLAHVDLLLADCEYVREGDLETAARYARRLGLEVTTAELRHALPLSAPVIWSVTEGWVTKLDHAQRAKARACIVASTRFCDERLPANYRTSAWTQIQAELRRRWIGGNFSVPSAETMAPWCVGARAINIDTWQAADAPEWTWPVDANEAVAA